MNNVFVYGTLKYGFHNHKFIKDSKPVCHAMTEHPYLLLGYTIPFMIEDDNDFNTVRVSGEVYSVDDKTLEVLDTLEGHPYLYERKFTWVINDKTKERMQVYAYFGNIDFVGSKHDIIKDGVF